MYSKKTLIVVPVGMNLVAVFLFKLQIGQGVKLCNFKILKVNYLHKKLKLLIYF